MRNELQKIFAGILALIASASGSLHAMDDYSYCEPECCSPAPFCSQGNWFGSAEALVWVADETGLEDVFGRVSIDTIDVDGVTTTAIRRCDKAPSFHWEPGFRLGLGYDFFCEGWNVSSYWTNFHGKATRPCHSGASTGRWGLNFNVVDTVVEGNLWSGCSFTLKPFGGFRYVNIHQRLHAEIKKTLISTAGTEELFITFNDRQRMWGLGPVVGLEADWDAGCGFCFYGSFGVSTFRGETCSCVRDINPAVTTVTDISRFKRVKGCQVALDGAVGICYEREFCGKLVTMHLGWEQHHYFSHNFMTGLGYGDLCLEGLNIGAAVQF